MKPASNALIIYRGKLLLFLRDNDSSISDPNTWSLVGGEVDGEESYEQTMVREMDEEINITPKEIRYLGKIKTPNGISHAIFLVKLTDEEVEKIQIGNEGQRVKFFSIGEIRKLNLARNVRMYFDLYGNYIEEILNSDKSVDITKLGLIR